MGVGGWALKQNRAGRSRSEPRKNPFSNFKISRKKYLLEKQLEINHTAGSVLPNARDLLGQRVHPGEEEEE